MWRVDWEAERCAGRAAGEIWGWSASWCLRFWSEKELATKEAAEGWRDFMAADGSWRVVGGLYFVQYCCPILLCLQIVNRGVVIVFVFVVQFLDHVTKYCCVYSIKMRVEWLVRLKPREIWSMFNWKTNIQPGALGNQFASVNARRPVLSDSQAPA